VITNVFHLHLREMCEFMRWGDQQSLVAARSVNDENYYKELGISQGSVHKMLVHLMAGQWLWLCRFRGDSPKRMEDHTDFPKRMDVEQRWPLVHAALIDFVGRQTQNQLNANISYHDTRGETHTLPLRDMILHLIDHGSYHRGQINTMIKRSGGTPIAISYRLWAAERAKIMQ
jgi:uncharacterized damage-inducible protein DinB